MTPRFRLCLIVLIANPLGCAADYEVPPSEALECGPGEIPYVLDGDGAVVYGCDPVPDSDPLPGYSGPPAP